MPTTHTDRYSGTLGSGDTDRWSETDYLLLSGDMTDGDDRLLLTGDQQTGTDKLAINQSLRAEKTDRFTGVITAVETLRTSEAAVSDDGDFFVPFVFSSFMFKSGYFLRGANWVGDFLTDRFESVGELGYDYMLLEGDMTDGNDYLLLSGDAQISSSKLAIDSVSRNVNSSLTDRQVGPE